MERKSALLIPVALLLAALCLLFCVAAAVPTHGPAHECSCESCLLCLCVSAREKLADMAILIPCLLFSFFPVVFFSLCEQVPFCSRRWTPVCLKVKLSD